jgi:hypothetical protein
MKHSCSQPRSFEATASSNTVASLTGLAAIEIALSGLPLSRSVSSDPMRIKVQFDLYRGHMNGALCPILSSCRAGRKRILVTGNLDRSNR